MPTLFRSKCCNRPIPLILLIIVACVMLTACGAGPESVSSTPEIATPSPSPEFVPTALSGPPRIGSVVWAQSIEPQSRAPVDAGSLTVEAPVIYAVLPIESLPAGSQLIAHWYFNNTSLDALDSSMRIDQDRTSGWLEFHIEQTGTEPWPAGRYELAVTDGTNELQRAEITIS